MGEEHEFFLIHVEFEVPVRHSRAEVKEQEYIWAWDAGGTPELNCKCAVDKMTSAATNKERA